MAAIEGQRKTGLLRQRTGLAETAAQRTGVVGVGAHRDEPAAQLSEPAEDVQPPRLVQAEVLISMVLPWATSQRKMASNTSGASSYCMARSV